MKIPLTPELENLVDAKSNSGRYNSDREVVREAPRLLQEHEQVRANHVTEFNRELGWRGLRWAAVNASVQWNLARSFGENRKNAEADCVADYVLSADADPGLDEIRECVAAGRWIERLFGRAGHAGGR